MEKRNLFRTSLIILACVCISNFTNAQKVKVKKKKIQHHTNVKKHKAKNVRFHNHFNRPYRYANLPKCGTIVNVRPNGRLVAFRGVNYHCHNGIWYKPHKKKFIVIRPFIGIRIKTLPLNCYHFSLRNRKYHYYYGTYYVHIPKTNEYEVTPPPVGAKVDEIPNDFNETSINDTTYYELDGSYYKYLENEDMYEVIDLEK